MTETEYCLFKHHVTKHLFENKNNFYLIIIQISFQPELSIINIGKNMLFPKHFNNTCFLKL